MSAAPVYGLAGAVCVAVGLRGVLQLRAVSDVERRELADQVAAKDRHRFGAIRKLVNWVGKRFGPYLLRSMSANRQAAIIHKLDRAGRPAGMDLERYTELRAAALVFAVVLAFYFLLAGVYVMIPVVLGMGLIAMDWWLSRIGRRRQERLERDIPDFIDILAVTVRAGAGYRAALERVSRSLSGPPAEEVQLTLRQMDLGASRRDAFQALRERNDSPTLENFVAAQLQSEELGVPLADALASIAVDTRRAAAQNARRKAQRTAPKVTLISAALLMPATLLLIAVGLFIGENIHLPSL
ncbi:MAG: type II secretion system F family protein [Solirubrobacterales bacterium]|nr:type II secretion system F family protein [Solirubrobacterales bacterium]